MVFWIKGENKHFRKSLRETNLERAKEKGREIYHQLMGQIYSGNKVFSYKMGDLVEIYLDHQQKRVDDGLIVQGRHSTIKTILNHLIKFVGNDTKVDSIENTTYRNYFDFRRKHHPKVQNITLKNERSQISHLYKWGIGEGFIGANRLPKWTELKYSQPRTRQYLNRELYRKLYTHLNNWTKGINHEEDLYYRQLVRDFILVLSNTGMRFGECHQLKWEYINVIPSKLKYPNVKIFIPSHITKTRRERTTLGMRGDIFKRIKSYSPDTLSHNFVFRKFESDELVSKKILYKYWEKIMLETGLCNEPVAPTYYTLRHTFISYRLMYGNVNVFTLGKLVGTGIKYIQDHYGHLNIEDISEDYTKVVNKPTEFEDMFGSDLEL
jgi:integrase